MGITEVGTVTQHGIDIGYSDTFAQLYTDGNLTVDELIKYAWCASEEPYINAISNTDINVGNQQGAAITSMLSYIQRTAAQTDYDYKFSYVNDRLATGKPYSFNILVYAQNNTDYNAFVINSDNGTKYRLVTSIDSIQKIYAYVHEVNKRNTSYNLPTSGTIDQYYSDSYQRLRSNVDDGELLIYPMTVYVSGESFFISTGSCFAGNRLPYEGSMSDNFYSVQYDYIPEQNAWLSDMTYRCSYGVLSNYEKDTFLLRWAGNELEDFISEANNRENVNYYQYSDDIGILIKTDWVVTTFTWYMFVQTEEAIYNSLALMGLKCKFETGEHISDTLIPIISNTVVTGYTFDPTVETEFNDITDVTGNNISPTPPVPPTPTPTGDDYEDMSLGVSNVTLGGLTKYAILSKQELINLCIDYNTNQATAGTNFSNHIICLYRLGFGASDLVVTSSDKIKMIQSAGDVDFESSANYSLVTRQTPFIHFGSITVPRHTNTFYDFSPYSNYELYIPGCGWIPLPDNVAGRTLNVYLVFDLPTCSAKGIVRIEGGVYGGTTIATVNGIIGASVPFTIGENGMQRAAILSGSVQTAAALGTAFLGVGIGNPYMGASGVAMATTGIANNYVAGNTNFISTKGGASDFSAFGDGAAAMLKYNAPEIDPVVNNSMFGHTVGYLCNEVGTLGSFTGFTVCDNPHVTFSASSAERDEIERLLSMGVIL